MKQEIEDAEDESACDDDDFLSIPLETQVCSNPDSVSEIKPPTQEIEDVEMYSQPEQPSSSSLSLSALEENSSLRTPTSSEPGAKRKRKRPVSSTIKSNKLPKSESDDDVTILTQEMAIKATMTTTDKERKCSNQRSSE